MSAPLTDDPDFVFPAFPDWKVDLGARSKNPGAIYEAQLTLMYQALLKPGDVAVDGGANRGVHTVEMSRAVGPTGIVYAFEPSPKPSSILIERLVAGGFSNVALHLSALGRAEQQAEFYHYVGADYQSGLRGRDAVVGGTALKFTVAVTTMDKFVPAERPVRFVKLDLEGGEFDAMRGAERILSNDRPIICFENGLQSTGKLYGYDADAFFSFFEARDYRIYTAFGEALTLAHWGARSSHFQFYALPAERVELIQLVRQTARDAMEQDGDPPTSTPSNSISNRPVVEGATIAARANFLSDKMMPMIKDAFDRHSDWRYICDLSYAKSGLFDHVDASKITLVDTKQANWLKDETISDFQVVALEDYEAETVALIRQKGQKAVGLMSDIALRYQSFAPARFWAPSFTPPTRKIAILSGARSGSTVLGLELERLGVGHPIEHIQHPLVAFAQARDVTGFDLAKWQEALVLANTGNGVFSTKIIWQLLKDFQSALNKDDLVALQDFLKGFEFVVIHRKDIVAQAVSNYIANKTDIWHKWKSVSDTEYERKLAEVLETVDWDQLTGEVKTFEHHYRLMCEFVEEMPLKRVDVDFQEISNHAPLAAAQVAEQLGFKVDVAAARALEPSLKPTTSPVHHELIREMNARLKRPQEVSP